MGEGAFVGLDVHARSVVTGLIDERTGEVRIARGLARGCEAAGIACLVAPAPPSIPEPSPDPVPEPGPI